MIGKLSVLLAKKLVKNGNIQENEQEMYVYGFFMFLSHMFYLFVACIFGIVFNCFIESVIFYVLFQSIRRYAGGYHAKTETKCEILSTISIALCVFVVKITRVYDIKIFLLVLSCIFTTLVFILCPLDTPEKKLTKKEKKHFRKISWIILTFILTVVTISYLFELNILFSSSCMSLILEGILVSLGKVQELKKIIN